MTWLLFSLVSGVVIPDYSVKYKSHQQCQAVADLMYTKTKPIACFTSNAKFKQKRRNKKHEHIEHPR